MLKDFQFKFRNGIKIGHPCHNDEWAASLFGKKNGFFIEIGASIGVDNSSCYELEMMGWDGICVEPHSKSFLDLIQNRRVICQNCCLMGYDGEVEFYECGELYRQISRTSNSLGVYGESPRAGRIWAETAFEQGALVTKKCTTLLSLLDECNAPRSIEYLAIDIEGSEAEVLRAFPFNQKYKILAVSIENNFCDDIMFSNGYEKTYNWLSRNEHEYYYVLK